MLEARNICLEVDHEGESLFLLSDVNFCIPRGHFTAIVGPSGCGKTTLLKAIAGIKETTSGTFFWEGRDLAEDGDFEPYEIGYVPQFSIAYEELTVDENIESSARLRVDADEDELDAIIDGVLEETGLSEIADRPVKLLSGGQKRRLALAMELVSSPRILLCDEVTSGLDPRSEREIVELLHQLSLKDGRIVISVTHSLAQMELYDSIIVMVRGNLAYHGAPDLMVHYFGEKDFEEVYPKLALREPDEWRQSWLKHRVYYYQQLEKRHLEKFTAAGVAPPQPSPRGENPDDECPQPSFLVQFSTLLKRRFTILFRDRTQLWLQVAMIVIFPILVALFSSKGQEQLLHLTDSMGSDLAAEVQAQQAQAEVRARVGSAVSGIIMFQVILLGLMGSNNAAREVAGERLIMEKEKFAGASVGAYMASKLAFLGILVLLQSLWMFAFVQYCWPLRGDEMNHLLFLILANAAMTTMCLGISANCKTADQASLLSIYLVGFQLPLSGAVLALPEFVEVFTQPFISAYWAWSGSVNGGLESEVLKAVNSIVQTSFADRMSCLLVLAVHVLVGILLAYIGVRRTRWE
ncbi:MAG: ATP-binding cassette domain-containing protein [Akkermansia sp.]|nr:ATP-binding cassette domain-containing protein [Akkermansia sp.]MBR2314069.1 ATP-binding cassette domain-containing protein [Akkermansia sp.]